MARERVSGGWPNDKLAVAAEAPSLFYDILNAEPAIAKGFVQGCRWLRSGVASSEVAQGSNPAGPRVTFELALPPVEKADEISMLLVREGRVASVKKTALGMYCRACYLAGEISMLLVRRQGLV